MSKLLTAIILILISIPIFSQSKLSVNKGQSTSILQSQRAKKVDEIIAKYHEYNLFNGSVLIFKDGKEFWTTQNQFWQWVREKVIIKAGDNPLRGNFVTQNEEK